MIGQCGLFFLSKGHMVLDDELAFGVRLQLWFSRAFHYIRTKVVFLEDNNSLRTVEVEGSMPRLRILRLSGNRLRLVDVGAFKNLRTLYADNNSLTHLVNLNRLKKLENLSLRNQSGRGLWVFSFDDVEEGLSLILNFLWYHLPLRVVREFIAILARRWTVSNLLTRDVRDVKRLYLSGELIDPLTIKILVPDHPFIDLPLFRLHR